MQNAKWIRFGLTAVILAGGLGGVAVVGCSSSNNPATSADGGKQDGSMMMGTDSGGDDSSMGDSGGQDGGMEAAAPPMAKAYLVNASNFAPTGLRFCFAVASGDPGDGGSIALVPPYTAAPDDDTQSKAAGLPYPALFPGLGGPIDTHGNDPMNLDLAIYAIDASKIATEVKSNASEKTCPTLIGMKGTGGTLTLNTDYWYIGHITPGTLKDGTTWVAGVTGCMPKDVVPEEAKAQCPTGYLPTASDLGMQLWQVDNMTAVDGGATGVQFIHASLAWDNVMLSPPPLGQGAAATVLGAFEPSAQPPADAGAGDAGDAGDGGGVMPTGPTSIPLVPDAKFGDIKPMPMQAVPGLTDDMNSGVFALPMTADGGDVTPPFAYPFPYVEALSGLGTAGKIVPGKGFVFVFVGDPTQPQYVGADGGAADPDAGGQFNPAFPHFLGFPTANP